MQIRAGLKILFGCKRTPKKEEEAGKHHEGCLFSISWGFYAVALNVQV